jgi:DNA modification methylase
LKKSLTETKHSKINDLNLNRWKEYDDIITDSLWILNKRDNSGVHHAGYWGNFIPQIPNQLLRRYTKKGEWILDPFLGSGTSLIEAQRLGRNAVGVELSKKVLDQTKKNIAKETNPNKVKLEFVNGDSASIDLKNTLSILDIKSFQFQIFHPPYWDIIKFSDSKSDLSNTNSIEDFLKGFGKVLDNCLPHLDKKRFAAVVISDKYSNGEWIPLGFYVMQEVLKRRMTLKSTIVKNFEETTAKRNQKELWRYRALAGGFYVFKHEYIFIFQKK